MQLKDFTEANEDVFFLMQNSFNDFHLGLLRSSTLYVRELLDRSNEREEVSLILYILSLVALIMSFIVLIPVVHSIECNEEIEGGIAQEDDLDEYNMLAGSSGKRTKKAKGKTKTDTQFFLKFFVALCCIQAYYL